MRTKITEEELAKVVISTLQGWQWEIYQEVIGHGGRCDIVAVNKNIIWAIECKTSFGFPVLEQAFNWINKAHYVSIAVPRPKANLYNSSLGKRICLDYGIGVLCVNSGNRDEAHEIVKPKLHRKIIIPFKLHEEQKTIKNAGTTGGGYWTPFKRTVNNLISLVERKPGIEFKALMKELEHHYSSLASAKSCLKNFIGTKVIPELRTEIVDGKLCVFLAKKKLNRNKNS